MKKYSIIIEETVSQTFEVSAGSEKEALGIAEKKYNACEFVLAPGSIIHRCMTLMDSQDGKEDCVIF